MPKQPRGKMFGRAALESSRRSTFMNLPSREGAPCYPLDLEVTSEDETRLDPNAFLVTASVSMTAPLSNPFVIRVRDRWFDDLGLGSSEAWLLQACTAARLGARLFAVEVLPLSLLRRLHEGK